MDPILSEITSRMTREEKLALVAELKAAIADETASDALAGADGRAGACPRCGCGRSVRKGRGRSGEQRWLCRGCGRTWSAKTLGLLSRSKLPASAWMAFAECMADGLSLRESVIQIQIQVLQAEGPDLPRHVGAVRAHRRRPSRRGVRPHADSHRRRGLQPFGDSA